MKITKFNNYSFILFLISTTFIVSCHQKIGKDEPKKNYPLALVSFENYNQITKEVETHRANRLINLDTFLKFSKEKNTIILDTRSKFRYDRKHVKGARNLEFTEFTQKNLKRIIPDTSTRILIYCNNNFDGDPIDFASKIVRITTADSDGEILPYRKPTMLALNIPTYINLFGYGYKNLYELHELVNIGDNRIEFEGTESRKYKNKEMTELRINKLINENE